jgi:hypothetical protein
MPEVWVDRENYRNTKIVDAELKPLREGQIRVALDKYGLTANNVSYAVSGDMIGYWKYYPVDSGDGVNWGKVPVWGLADVVESRSDDIAVGERVYGFFPMQTDLVMTPGQISETRFVDVTDHRRDLAELYNIYNRTQAEPARFRQLENERCLLFPLFTTGYVLADYLSDNDYFGAEQIIIGSVSSKTAFSMAAFLKSETDYDGQIVGLTSLGNRDFVENLDDCDLVVTYGNEEQIDRSLRSVYVDMSGNHALRATIHNHLEAKMVRSISVGATHWDAQRSGGNLPGAKPEFFFAPAHIGKREAEWGAAVLFQKAYAAGAQLAEKTSAALTVEFIQGPDAARNVWIDMLDNKVSPKRGMMVSWQG